VSYLAHHYTIDPFIAVVAFTVFAHEVGLARLRATSLATRSARRRRRSYLFYAGLFVLLLAVVSPIDYWSSSYFFVHMIEHLLIAFAAPVLIVAGAPWIPLMFALPVRTRRRVGRFCYLSPKAAFVRAIGRFIRNPMVALISFNAAMLVWHIPYMFELAERNNFVHIVLMHGSFIVTGILFWLQIIPSYPVKPARGPLWQAGAVIVTNLVMTVMAISMSVLTAVSWYPSYAHIPGVTLSAFADQQIGAGVLWVCGDFWALPAIYVIVKRAIESEGSFSHLFDRLTGRGDAPTKEAFHASHAIDSKGDART